MIIASPVKEILITFLRRFRANRTEETDPVSYSELFLEISKYNKERSYDILQDPKNETARKVLDDCCLKPFNNHYVYTEEELNVKLVLDGRWTPREVGNWADNVIYDSNKNRWLVNISDPHLIY